jgi:H+-transporting ATPase
MTDAQQKETGDAVKTVSEVFSELSSSPKGLSTSEARARLGKYGPNALEEKHESVLKRLAGYFWGPIPWMIEAAAILSVIVRDWVDFSIILALLLFNALIGFLEEHKASNALSALKGQLALKARVLRDGKWDEIDASDLTPGDVVRLRPGDVIPADCKLFDGDYLSVDQAALTGESLPVAKKPGDDAYSGSVAKQGEMLAVVTGTGSNTFFGRTAKLVESAGAVSHFQKAVMKVGDFLIVTSVALSIILIVVELMRGLPALRLIEFVLILVVASIPVAMPAVLSMTMALGALSLSKQKAIVSKLQAIEEMAGISILCSDKTGTLTKNQLTLGDPVVFAAENAQDLILAGALASKAENRDPIDLAVIGAVSDPKSLEAYAQEKFLPFDPVGKRTEAVVKDSSGRTLTLAKGAPQVIMDLCNLDGADRERAQKAVDDFAAKGYRTIGTARKVGEEPFSFLGLLSLFDPPRDDSAETIAQAGEHGIKVKMVTGDNAAIGREISGKLGMGTNILPAGTFFQKGADASRLDPATEEAIENADGFAEVFPEHKYGIVKALQNRGHIVAMTGDGVNDAPALKQADVGIAVSGATDAARAAAALVLTAPGLSVIIKAVEEARRIFERMMSYTIYRIAMTIDIMVFVVLSMLGFDFYPLTAVMIILLALLDDIPIMTIAYDNTRVDPNPVRWDMGRVLSVSSVLGALAVIETFGLLFIGRQYLGLPDPQLRSMLFLQLVAGGHLMLFLTRTKGPFWKPPYPSKILFWAIVGTQVFAVLLCGLGWLVPALPWRHIFLVWAYNLVWMVLQDVVKMGVYKVMEHSSFACLRDGIRRFRKRYEDGFAGVQNRVLRHHGDIHTRK